MFGLLDDATAASIVAAVLAILLAVLGLDAIGAERLRNRIIERQSIERIRTAYYEMRPTGDAYYSFAPDLALRKKVLFRGRRICMRARLARALRADRYNEGCDYAAGG